MHEILRGVLHGGGHPLFGHPEAMLIAIIIAVSIFGAGAVIFFLVRKFLLPPPEKKW